jgi:hypothetical protein
MINRERNLLAIVIGVAFGICLALISSPASGASVSQDGAGDWRINTFTEDEIGKEHLVFGQVYIPGKGTVFENTYGAVDTRECSMTIVGLKAFVKSLSNYKMKKILKVIGHKDYIVSMVISVCQPAWYVIYLNTGKDNASKEVYDKVFEALQ